MDASPTPYESPILSATRDLLLWLLPQAARFPRTQRYGLNYRLARGALDMQEALVLARMGSDPERAAALAQADRELVRLAKLVRTCKDNRMFTLGQYRQVSAMLVEIGYLLVGWQRSLLQ